MVLAPVVAAAEESPVVLSSTLPTCVPSDSNAVVGLSVRPFGSWSSVRVYFRQHGEQDWYFLEMRAFGDGRYWAALPKPVKDNLKVDIRFVVRDDTGKLTASDEEYVPVTSQCQETLTAEQAGFAHNLVIGETTENQRDKGVFGFQCDGIVSRLWSNNELHGDEYCRKALLAAAQPSKKRLLLLLPLIFAGGGGNGGGVVTGGGPGTVSGSTP